MSHALLGPHLGGSWANKLDILRQWQPPFVLLLQPEVEKVQQLRAACPGAIIVGRFYHEDSWYAHNISTRPIDFADDIHNEIVANPVTPLLDYVQSNNEVCQDWRGIQHLNTFTSEWMHLADESGAYKCAILAFSNGNPDMPYKPGDSAGFDGRMLYWQQVLPSLNYAQRNGHILLLHAYGWPDMFHPDADWYIYRYERQVQANLRTLGITSLKYAYGEIGIDKLIVGEKGGYKSVPTSDQDYTNQLLQWERDLQGQDLLLGGAIFTFGDSGGWGSYDITSTHVASMLAASGRGDTSPQNMGTRQVTTHLPFTPNQSPTVTTPDLLPRNISADFKRRVPTITLVVPTQGARYYRLVEAGYYPPPEGARKFGPDHHILVDVLDETGKREMETSVNFYWADDMKIDRVNKVSEPYGADYGMSSAGYGFGVWVGDFRQNSDDVFGMGLGTIEQPDWNHHVSYYLVFQRVTVPAAQPAPTPQLAVPFLAHPIADPTKRVISQPFGVGGHRGIDYAIVSGTPIGAVDAGVVQESGFDDGGYGEYIKLRHAWGESLYAHLSRRKVEAGEHVNRGNVIGNSGNTGNSTGPHLHLGIRVFPYKRGHPYDGFSDPLPYLGGESAPTQGAPTGDLLSLIRAAADEFGIDHHLLTAQVMRESSFNPNAVSAKGAQGLLQIMPATWREWSEKVGGTDPFNPSQNLRVGAAYLAWLRRTLASYGDAAMYMALVSYGWGIGNMLEKKEEPPLIWRFYASEIMFGSQLLESVEGIK